MTTAVESRVINVMKGTATKIKGVLLDSLKEVNEIIESADITPTERDELQRVAENLKADIADTEEILNDIEDQT